MKERATRRTVLLAVMSLGLGGAETHVLALAKGLAQRGVRVIVVSAGGVLVDELAEPGMSHVFAPLAHRSPLGLLRARGVIGRLVREEGVDLVHAHARIPAFVADWALRGRVPLITTAHATYRSGLFWRFFTRFGERTIAVSGDVAAYIRQHLGARTPITVIPNGIDTGRFSPRRDGGEVRQRFGLGGGPLILHMSRFATFDVDMPGTASAAWALMELLPRLSEHFPGLQLLLVGDGPVGERVRERAVEANRLLGRPAVVFAGGQTETAPFFAAADVVVAVGRTALEAMATGKPVLVAGEGGVAGVFSPDTLPDLRRHNFTARELGTTPVAEALMAVLPPLLQNPAAWAELGAFGRQMVEGEYDIRRMVDEVLEVYEAVWSGGNGSADLG